MTVTLAVGWGFPGSAGRLEDRVGRKGFWETEHNAIDTFLILRDLLGTLVLVSSLYDRPFSFSVFPIDGRWAARAARIPERRPYKARRPSEAMEGMV